jgi:RNA polymerase sigma factor (sigma-70 family)
VAKEVSDIQYWIKMKEGNAKAFDFLLKKYTNQLLNYGYKFVKDEDFVKDCVQEVFIEIWKRKERLTDPESVKAYLLSSVRKKVFRESYRNASKDFEEWNNTNQNQFFEMSTEWLMISEENEDLLKEKIKRILDHLPKRQREAIYLQYFQNLSREEIAQTMEINQQSVSNLLQSAFKVFREKWKEISAILLIFQNS